jgi:hypothetical protein
MASQKRSAIAEKNRLSDAMRDFEDHMVRARALFEGGLGFAKFVDRLPGEFATMPSPGMPPNVNVIIPKYLSQRAIPQPYLPPNARTQPISRGMPSSVDFLNPKDLSHQLETGRYFSSNAEYLSHLMERMRTQPSSRLPQGFMSANASIPKYLLQPPQRLPQGFMSANASIPKYLLQRVIAYGLPRFPIGTDASAQYASAGMASAWLPSSSNQYLSGMRYTPGLLRALANYGMPIAPALAASVSGSTPDTLNTAAEASRRSIGILPSLQTLTGLTQSEQEMLRGYIEGVGGLPWADTVDFIAKMTSNLQSPQRARSGG